MELAEGKNTELGEDMMRMTKTRKMYTTTLAKFTRRLTLDVGDFVTDAFVGFGVSGEADGDLVTGTGVGSLVAAAVGFEVGSADGGGVASVGFGVGSGTGAFEGGGVGSGTGSSVGFFEGGGVGSGTGSGVGFFEGGGVGSGTGVSSFCNECIK